jgi:hypothetical protein
MVIFADDYKLGHSHNFDTPKEAWNYIKQMRLFSLPIYLIPSDNDMNISTRAPALKADDYMAGWIYASHKDLAPLVNVKRLGIHAKRLAAKILEKEVDNYNIYLHEVGFTFTISDKFSGHKIKTEGRFFTEEQAVLEAQKAIDALPANEPDTIKPKKRRFHFLEQD